MKGVFIMLMRSFAGKNERNEWIAVRRIMEESGIATEIIYTAGQTN